MNEVTLPMALSRGAADPAEIREARHAAVERLRSAAAARRPLDPLVTAAARALAVSPRTVWRWLAEGTPGQRTSSAWRASVQDIDAYTRWKGNAAAAWRERSGEEAATPGLRTFQTALITALTPGDRATLRDGVAGRRRHQVYLRWESEARNDRWEVDHKQLDVAVLFPRAQRPRQPWVTTFLDAYSRAVMGWAIADHPSSATVVAALGEAIRVDVDRGPFGGLPAVIRPDRGLEFAAEVMERACGILAVRLIPAPPYHPHLKGRIERFFESVIDQLLRELPHFTGGPRDAAGRLWGAGLPVLTLADFVGRFDRYVRSHNEELPHQALGGQTPLQRWLGDATPLQLVSDEDLRWTLLGEEGRTVGTSGIRFHGLSFIAPELNGLVGERVQIRFRPHDDTSIEVFRGVLHLCTARPQHTLGPEEKAAVLAQRRADAQEQARRQRRAAAQVRERFSPATARAPAEDLTVITAQTAGRRRGGTGGEQMRRLARVDLLGIPELSPP